MTLLSRSSQFVTLLNPAHRRLEETRQSPGRRRRFRSSPRPRPGRGPESGSSSGSKGPGHPRTCTRTRTGRGSRLCGGRRVARRAGRRPRPRKSLLGTCGLPPAANRRSALDNLRRIAREDTLGDVDATGCMHHSRSASPARWKLGPGISLTSGLDVGGRRGDERSRGNEEQPEGSRRLHIESRL